MKKVILLSVTLFLVSVSLFGQLKVANGNNVYFGYNSPESGAAYPWFCFGDPYPIATNPQGVVVVSSHATWGLYMKSNRDLVFGVPVSSNSLLGNVYIKYQGTYPFPLIGLGKEPSYMLDVNGTISCTGTIQTSSDSRLKTSIHELTPEFINNLYNLHGYSYIKSMPEVKNEFGIQQNPVAEYGFMAQEVQKYFPELVQEDAEGYLSVNYIALIPVLVEVLKAQQKQIDDLKNQIQDLRK